MAKHDGCWYCASKRDELLTAIQKRVIQKDGSESTQGAALCSTCVAAPVLDLRISADQRRAA